MSGYPAPMSDRSYTEEEIAAEEERIGSRLPDELRGRLLDGVPETVLLRDGDGDVVDSVELLGPSTTDTDTKGREYPTEGMAAETDEVRSTGDGFVPDDVVVAWGQAADGSLAVVRRDGSLGFWTLGDEEVEPVEVDWDPDPDLLAEL